MTIPSLTAAGTFLQYLFGKTPSRSVGNSSENAATPVSPDIVIANSGLFSGKGRPQEVENNETE